MNKNPQVTLNDIAKILNVSKVTVSKALRDYPDIGAETKQLVRKTAEKLGYVPNYIARNLSAKRSNTIGLVVPKIAHHFFASTIESIYETAEAHQYEIIMTVSQENTQREIKHIQTLLSMRVDGLLVSVTAETKEKAIFETVKKRGLPLVFFDRTIEYPGVSQVTSDDEGGSYEATRQLIMAGYRRITHFAGFTHTNIGKNRLNGYKRAMAEHGLDIFKEHIIESGFGESDGYKNFMQLFQQDKLPQAIYAVTYPVALGVLLAAEETGIKVPNELDLICFGGSDYNRFIKPALSFIEQPTHEIGKRATELLIDEIKHPDTNIIKDIIIPTKLKKFQTCINCKESNPNG